MVNNTEFHIVFRAWLDSYDMRAAEFARRYGCSREMVRQWLSGQVQNPQDDTIDNMCEVLNVTVEEFWAGPPLKPYKKPVITKKKTLKKKRMKKLLTKRQQQILDFIISFMQNRGYPPTLREIGNTIGIGTPTGVRVNLEAIEKKKYIIRRPWLSRGIELVDEQKNIHTESDTNYIPIIGKGTPGEPIFSADNIEGMLTLDDSYIQSQKVFAYKAHDDSMSGAGIIDGDYVIAERQHIATKDDNILVIVGDEIMVRRYDEKGRTVLLIPKNEAYDTMIIKKSSSDLQIVGKVIGLMRRY